MLELRPKIILTAGHNGPGTGARTNQFDEATEAIRLRDDLAEQLRKWGWEVLTEPNTAKLNSVLQWLKKTFMPKDVLIDIHFNASANPRANGTEAFIQEDHYTATEFNLAGNVTKTICNTLNVKNRGVKHPSLSQHSTLGVLDKTHLHAILLEVCFITSDYDVRQYRANYQAVVYNTALTIHSVLL